MFGGKTLLITGGTGSFGNAVLRRFLNTDIGEVRIFSRDERKQDEMRHRLQSDKVKFYIGDVRDYRSIEAAMYGVDYVFSAAALKQVPSCEFYPLEAVYTNVLGTENTLNAAIHNQVKNIIVLSTDKAVYPINAMGMSKALMEKVAVARARTIGNDSGPVICVTRYGNVMASRGSVIPLFTRQLKTGQPLTVTDLEMTRFMMSLDEAIDLVLYAFQHGQGGDIFVRKAPAATIGTLVESLKTIFEADNEVRVIGTRHGEKKHESLLNREEMARALDLENYYRIPTDVRDLNYGKYFEQGESKVSAEVDYTSANTRQLDKEELMHMLRKLDYIQRVLAGDHQADEGY